MTYDGDKHKREEKGGEEGVPGWGGDGCSCNGAVREGFIEKGVFV